MKTTKTSALSILIAGIVSVFPVQESHAKKHGGGEGGGEGGEHMKNGLALMDQKHFDQAADEFGKAIAASPNDPKLYHNRAIAYFSGAQAAEAARQPGDAATRYVASITDFSKELELAPKDIAGYLGRGQVEYTQKAYDTAIADFNKALELKPDDPVALKFRASAEIGMQQWDKAVADLNIAIQKDPNDLLSYDRRAWAYRNLTKPDAAIADYTTIIQKDPANADAYAKRGYTSSLPPFQQYEKAIADYEQAMKLNPNDQETPQRLQYARGMLAMKNAPPQAAATPTPTPGPGLITPVNIIIAMVVLIGIAVVVRLLTRGKEEPTSSRIR